MAARRSVRERRNSDATKLSLSVTTVVVMLASVVIWVISIVGAYYGVQSKMDAIQSDVRNLSTEVKGGAQLVEKDNAGRDEKIHDLENTVKAHDIRIRNLETENARRGAK